MNRSDILSNLESLAYNHDEEKCDGCSTCSEINDLRNILFCNSKVDSTLSKGPDMTKRELAYLLVKEVSKQKICESLQMGITALNEMIYNYGWELEKGRRGEEMAKLKEFTELEYHDLKATGLNDEQIAEKKGVSAASIWNWKKKNGLTGVTKYNPSGENGLPVKESSTSRVNELELENEQLKSELSIAKRSLLELSQTKEENVPSNEFEIALEQNSQLNYEIQMVKDENQQLTKEIGYLRGLVGLYLKAQ
jgi:transposase